MIHCSISLAGHSSDQFFPYCRVGFTRHPELGVGWLHLRHDCRIKRLRIALLHRVQHVLSIRCDGNLLPGHTGGDLRRNAPEETAQPFAASPMRDFANPIPVLCLALCHNVPGNCIDRLFPQTVCGECAVPVGNALVG